MLLLFKTVIPGLQKVLCMHRKHGPNATGIVYCLTQKNTVSLASMLEVWYPAIACQRAIVNALTI